MGAPEDHARAMWSEDRASQGLGMEIVAVRPGSATVAMTLTQAMANGHGIAHGGFIFALADTAFAFACNSHGDRAVAQHCAITFVRPAHVGERLVANAREVSRRGRSGITDVTVMSGTEVVAEFRGHSRLTSGSWAKAEGGDG